MILDHDSMILVCQYLWLFMYELTCSLGYYGEPPRRHRSPLRSRAPLDPYSVDIPVSFRTFSEWYRFTHPDIIHDEDKVKREASDSGKDVDVKTVDHMRAHFDAYKRKMLLKQVS